MEALVLLVQLRLLLLAHGAAQDVRLAQRVAGHLLGDRHHLLLVHDQPVGGAQDVLERLGELGVDGRDLLRAVLAQRVVGVGVRPHGPGPVQGDGRGDVLEVVGAHELEQLPHGTAVQLEHPEGVPACEQLVGAGVVDRQVLQVQHEAVPVERDVLQGVGDDREVAQPQEVHLDQPQALARGVVELGDHLAVLLAAHERDDVDQRVRGHDHARGVHTPLALEPLQTLGGLEDLHGLGVVLEHLAQLPGLVVALGVLVVDVLQGDALAHDVRRHGLGEPLPHGERVAEHAGGVLQGLLGLDGAVRHDHGHALVAVLLRDVVDHLGAAAVVEVHVEVGHGHAVRVEEALEDQPVGQGVQLGDAHGVRDHGTGAGATARTHADAVVLGPVDEVRDHQEVAREAHLDDDLLLVLGLLPDVVRDATREAVVQPLLDLLDEPRGLVLALGGGEARHVVGGGVEVHLAALGDLQGVVAGLREVPEDLPHLLRGLEVELVGVELEALGVLQGGAGLNAQQRGVGLGVLRVGVVQVVGGHQGQVQLPGQAQQVPGDPLLDAQPVVHELAVEVLGPEDVPELRGGLHGLVVLAQPQPGLHLARGAARGGDQPLAVLVQQLPVHAGLVQLPLQGRLGGRPEEVLHALARLREQGHVGVSAGSGDVVPPAVRELHARAVLPGRARGQVGLHTDDRFDPGGTGLVPEVERAEHEPVVRGGQGVHAQPVALLEEVV
nr:hypothetical protein [Kocuria tytonis]